MTTIKRKLTSLEELKEKILEEPTLAEKIKWFFEDLLYSIRNIIAYIFVKLGLSIGYRGAWNSVVKTIKHPQVWEFESHTTEYMLPRLEQFITKYAARYIEYPGTYDKDRKRWIKELEAVKYFLEVLYTPDLAEDESFDEEKYYLGRLVFGKVYETLWY